MIINNKTDRTFISLDLGTTNIIAYVAGQGIIFNEPSLIAYDLQTAEISAVGIQAYEMLGKVSNEFKIIKPLVDGVISDMEATQDILRHVFNRLKITEFWKDSIVLLACPAGVTELEKESLKSIAYQMGAKFVVIEQEVKMAAIGSGVNIELPNGHLVIDIGGGTTDIAIISKNAVVCSNSVRNAGNHFTDEISKYIRSEYNLSIGFKTAENIKKQIGSLSKYLNEISIKVYGRDIISGLPRGINLSSEEVRNVLLNSFSKIIDAVLEVMEHTPSELAADLVKNGITLTGGGSLIRNIDKYFNDVFGLKVIIPREPLLCVIEGTKQYEKIIRKKIQKGVITSKKPINILSK